MISVMQVLWSFLPVILAAILNVVIVKKQIASGLNIPLDFGAHFRGRRLFGNNKTLRGLIALPLFSGIFGLIEGCIKIVNPEVAHWELFSYLEPPLANQSLTILYAYGITNAFLGLCYILGELPNSFIKRQYHIGPGEKARGYFKYFSIFIDMTDSILFTLLMLILICNLPIVVALQIFIFLTLFHLFINLLLLSARIKESL